MIITGRNFPPFLKPSSVAGSRTNLASLGRSFRPQMDEMMRNGTPEQIARVTQAFLKMKKFDLAELRKAYQG